MKVGMSRYAFALLALLLPGTTSLAQYGGAPVTGTQTPLQVAQEKLRRANADAERMERETRQQLEKTPEYAEAKRASDAASADREKARSDALSNTRASAPYIQAQQKLQKSEQIIAAGNRREASSRQVTTATNDAIDARLEISRLESDALAKSIPYRDADLRLKSASSRVDELWQATKQDEMANNRAYRSAIGNQQAAEQEVKVAQESMRLARQQMAAQQQSARPQRTATPRSSRASRGGGGGGGGMRRGGY